MHGTDPRHLVRDLVDRRHGPAEGSVRVVREVRTDGNAVLAVAFDDQAGGPRRALFGFSQDDDGIWRSTGSSSGRPRVADEADVWVTWGGWGPPDPSGAAAVVGGWVADPGTVVARLTDPRGRVLEDRVEEGVAIFLWNDELAVRGAGLELLDAAGAVLRRGRL